MSFKKLLLLFTVVLYLSVFSGTFIISVNNLRNYMQNELAVSAQNTASSLGASLSQYTDNRDSQTMELLIDAVFKTGNYQKILFEDTQGEVLFERHLNIHNYKKTGWLSDIVPLHIIPGEALVMNGWQQRGAIKVYGNTQQAYADLWTNTLEIFTWFLLAALITFIIGAFFLRKLLNSFSAVQHQAEMICQKKFIVNKQVPKLTELRHMVLAMNDMSERLHTIFDEQATMVDKLREQAYQDELTKLPNRKLLMMSLENMLQNKEDYVPGTLIFLEISKLNEFKVQHGYAAFETYLDNIIELINQKIHQRDSFRVMLARISEISLGIFIQGGDLQEYEAFLQELEYELKIKNEHLGMGILQTHMGAVTYEFGEGLTNLLSSVDFSLRKAQQSIGPDYYIYKKGKDISVKTSTQWYGELKNILKEKRIKLEFMTAYLDDEKTIYHREALLRVKQDDIGYINAGKILPILYSHNMIGEFDKLVIEKIIEKINEDDNQVNYAINLSPHFVQNQKNADWLVKEILNNKDIGHNLSFEFTEHDYHVAKETMDSFIDKVKSFGVTIGIDHYGAELGSIRTIRNTEIDYVKLDSHFSMSPDSQDNQFYMELLLNVIRNLDMKIIATSVEHVDDLNSLKALGLKYFQGYYFTKPK